MSSQGIGPGMAHRMKLVEGNPIGTDELDEMTDETKAASIHLYSLLISYLRNRPYKLAQWIRGLATAVEGDAICDEGAGACFAHPSVTGAVC